MSRQVFGQNQRDVMGFLFRQGGDGWTSRSDVEDELRGADPVYRSRDPRQGARLALKRLVERGLVEKDRWAGVPVIHYRITQQGREVVRRWQEEE